MKFFFQQKMDNKASIGTWENCLQLNLLWSNWKYSWFIFSESDLSKEPRVHGTVEELVN